jgi:hypothetical protein
MLHCVLVCFVFQLSCQTFVTVQFRKLVSHVTTAGSADFIFSDAGAIRDEDMFELCAELHVSNPCVSSTVI